MNAITLWQPWATLLVKGIKQVETRSWFPRVNLPQTILIHAARRSVRRDELYMVYQNIGINMPGPKSFPLSAIIGVIDLENYFLMTQEIIDKTSNTERACGLWTPGRYGWNCSNPIIFYDPVPCKGQQLFWKPDAATLAIALMEIASAKQHSIC